MTEVMVDRRLGQLRRKYYFHGLTLDERAERKRLINLRNLRVHRTRVQLERARRRVADLEKRAASMGITC